MWIFFSFECVVGIDCSYWDESRWLLIIFFCVWNDELIRDGFDKQMCANFWTIEMERVHIITCRKSRAKKRKKTFSSCHWTQRMHAKHSKFTLFMIIPRFEFNSQSDKKKENENKRNPRECIMWKNIRTQINLTHFMYGSAYITPNILCFVPSSFRPFTSIN